MDSQIEGYGSINDMTDMDTINSRYSQWSFIDRGGDGTVYKAYDNLNKNFVAIKQYNKNQIVPLLRETSLLRKVNCEFIISLRDIFNSDEFIYVVIEFAGKNILELISGTHIKEYEREKITVQLIESINYLHSIGYIHGDINFKNVLFSKTGTKLIDFCSSVRTHRNVIYQPTIYVCPYELLINICEKKILAPLDIWMLGCICFFLTTSIPLFVSFDARTQLEMVHNHIGILKIFNKNIIQKTEDKPLSLIKKTEYSYIKKMLSLNPYNRETIEQIVKKTKLLYNKFNIKPSDEKIYMLDKYNIKNVCSKYNNHERLDITTKLCQNSNLETIFITLKNVIRLDNECNEPKYIAICYWISCGLIIGSNLTTNNLLNYYNILSIDIDPNDNDIYKICYKLNWDLDPYTTYDYIKYIKQHMQQYFIFLNFLLIIEPSFDIVTDINKVIILYAILKYLFNIRNKEMEQIINNAMNQLNIDKFYLTNLYIDILIYMNNFQNNISTKIIYLNKLFDSKIIEWFKNINFKNMYSKPLF